MPRNRDQKLISQIGQRVAKIRRNQGWTQERLSEAIGMEPLSISKLETGHRALSLSTLALIADALQVGLGDLIDVKRDLPVAETDPLEAELVTEFRRLPAKRKRLVIRLVKELPS